MRLPNVNKIKEENKLYLEKGVKIERDRGGDRK